MEIWPKDYDDISKLGRIKLAAKLLIGKLAGANVGYDMGEPRDGRVTLVAQPAREMSQAAKSVLPILER